MRCWVFVGHHLVRRYKADMGLILLLAVLFAVWLGLMCPVNAADLFLYDFQGGTLVHRGENPYVHASVEFTADPNAEGAGQ